MAYVDSVNWVTGEITILQASMTLVQGSPEIRELDIDALRLELRDLEDDADQGRPWPRTHNHSTIETLVGTTYQRKVTFLDPYYFTFTGSAYSINLVNGDNNLSAQTPAYNVRVNTANSAGSTVVVTGSGVTQQDKDDIINGVRVDTKYTDKFVFIDTENVSNGDGSAGSPFNNTADAVDYAEAQGYKKLVVYSDLTVDRTMKNFVIIGVGTPAIDCNGQNLAGSEFKHCYMRGTYAGAIIVQESVLDDNFWLSGNFERCGLAGDLFCVDGATILMATCFSMIPGLGRPTVSMNVAGTCLLSVRGHRGGFTVKHCNQATDKVTVGIAEGSLTFDSSNNDGEMVARGKCLFVDETTGASVTDETSSPIRDREVHEAHFNKRKHDTVAKTITIYAADGFTPLHVFDAVDDLSEITPQ